MRSVLLLVATVATIVFNGLASAGYINNVTPAVISDRYPTVVTPAGYAFSIWSLIYVGLISFSIYQLLPRNLVRFRSVRSLYVITCVLNCSWIFFWHRDEIGYCLALIGALLVTLIAILVQFRRSGENGIVTKGVFGLYAGWVTAASLVNAAIFLKSIDADIGPSGWQALGVGMLILTAVAAAVIRWRLKNYTYPLAIAWAATAIAVKQSGNTAIVVAASFAVIVGLVMAVSFVMEGRESERYE